MAWCCIGVKKTWWSLVFYAIKLRITWFKNTDTLRCERSCENLSVYHNFDLFFTQILHLLLYRSADTGTVAIRFHWWSRIPYKKKKVPSIPISHVSEHRDLLANTVFFMFSLKEKEKFPKDDSFPSTLISLPPPINSSICSCSWHWSSWWSHLRDY